LGTTGGVGAPLTIDATRLRQPINLKTSLRLICDKIHAYGEVAVGKVPFLLFNK
jgi:3-hexulose-6-phosphate synthase/6-phospho-3-hexuloisomerase